jgi:hypothetical protein
MVLSEVEAQAHHKWEGIKGRVKSWQPGVQDCIPNTIQPANGGVASEVPSPLGEKVRLKIPPFDELRVVSEVEPPKAGMRGKS